VGSRHSRTGRCRHPGRRAASENPWPPGPRTGPDRAHQARAAARAPCTPPASPPLRCCVAPRQRTTGSQRPPGPRSGPASPSSPRCRPSPARRQLRARASCQGARVTSTTNSVVVAGPPPVAGAVVRLQYHRGASREAVNSAAPFTGVAQLSRRRPQGATRGGGERSRGWRRRELGFRPHVARRRRRRSWDLISLLLDEVFKDGNTSCF
jgi:hypothetical protein